ncbi:MAG: DUF4974 domain-containing protein [Tannerellaceae bacterium]|jgi:ferric-dicitrate binding protein FerR (iron transport regulator)|nr:DUF4974 domain-containing protein [Tannerellaceae bacterium]
MEKEKETLREALRIKKQIEELEACDIAGGYSAMQRKITSRNRKRRMWTALSRAAAILAIPLLLSSLLFAHMAFNGNRAEHITLVEIESAPGLVTRFELPDKSAVWLNSGSTLRYPSAFTDSIRQVELNGEGYFEVKSNPQNPFYVGTASGIRVMAYGTRFNINTTEESTETVLAEGKADILLRDKSLQKLTPGEAAVFDMEKRALSIQKVNTYEKTAWKDGKIIFRNAPLNEVFQRLSRRYNVDIVLHDEHGTAGKYSARVTFSDETIQQIFAYLEVAAPIRWKLSTPEQNSDSTLAKQRIDVWLIKK